MRADSYQVCLVTVDGTDFRINEPNPFNPSYCSHKFKHAALRYEVAVCLKTGWIVWINGPFPAGEWTDLRIARLALNDMLLAGEYYIADGIYRNDHADTPRGTWLFEDRQKATARARHENINWRFKVFKCLREQWRHDREKHGNVMYAVANIVQLGIMRGGLIFQIAYDERDFVDEE